VPFGGAGPMQAAQIAEELGIDTVVAPPNPGVTSAHGLLASDFIKYETLTNRAQVDDATCDDLRVRFDTMRADLENQFLQMDFSEPLNFSYTLEMRYVGQAFEVPLELDRDSLAALDRKALEAAFIDAHHRIYFHSDKSGRPIEVVALRAGATLPTPHVSAVSTAGASLKPAPGELGLYDGSGWTPCRRETVAALTVNGTTLSGPAVLEDYTTTVLVPAGWSARVDAQSNLILAKEA
jgi:N-methylhydantoinase A